MIVLKGKNSGFCFGVKRAIDRAVELAENDGRIFVLGEIIHNDLVNKKLANLGIVRLTDPSDAILKPGDTVIIRTHGEPKATFECLASKGVNIVDATCPFVKDIQKIVAEHHQKGYKIVIIGKSEHPEIIGINGWCDDQAVITCDVENILRITSDKICIVVQTTFDEKKYDEIIKKITFTDAKTVDIFKTICYTTSKRQKEAEYLSRECDAIIVLGGANSSNTERLYDICRKNCDCVFRINDPLGFDYEKIKNYYKVGIVFGASTPIEQFQEVISNMEKVTEEITTNTVNSEELAETAETTVVEAPAQVAEEPAKKDDAPAMSEMEKAFKSIKPSRKFKNGQVITVIISGATENGVTLSLKDGKSDFELPAEEMLGEYVKDEYKDKIGTSIRVMVVGLNPLRVSEKAMEKVLKEEAEIEEIKNGKIFEVVIDGFNKGGLTAKYGKFDVFVPSSQIRLGFVKDFEKYVGKPMTLKAEKVEINHRIGRRQIVGSHKVIVEAEKAERDAIKAAKEKEFFDAVQEGDIVIGTPVRFAAFGAFVEVNGFDCLAHISDLSWTGCSDCSEVLELNKEYEFKVLKLDQEKKKVSIGYKQLQPRPWDTVVDKYKVGDVINGKVVRLVSFGAFVEIEKGVDGLVHVSQISNEWLENPVTALQVGQVVDAKILEINVEKEKINLSIKALLPEVEKPVKEDGEEKKGKGKKRAKADEEDAGELREWKDEGNNGVSISDLLNK